jgi:hypothetical protein
LEIIHILAGPIVGVVITVLAFSDDSFIKRKLRRFFLVRRTEKRLAGDTEAIVSGAIALATFLGNVYLLFWNCFLAIFVFPPQYRGLTSAIWEVMVLGYGVRAAYVFSQYELRDLGSVPAVGKTLYDRFLRLEQVAINVFTTIYFTIGILLDRVSQAASWRFVVLLLGQGYGNRLWCDLP